MNNHFFKVLLAFVLIAGNTQAQYTFGVRAGLNANKIWGGTGPVTNMKAGFQIGAVADYSLNDRFSIEHGLLFTTLGYQIKGLAMPAMKNMLIKAENRNYIQIPVRFLYKFGNGLSFHAGTYFSRAISGKVKGNLFPIDGEIYNYEYKLRFGENDNSVFDCGLSVGIAMRFGNFKVGLEGNRGLISLEQSKSYHKNGGFAFNTTYMFGK